MEETAMKMTFEPKEALCVDCKKMLRRMLCKCPSCKTTRCWLCWSKHIDDKVCAYGRAKVIGVAI
jgi:hypothetical protein